MTFPLLCLLVSLAALCLAQVPSPVPSSYPPDADGGIVNGECHNLGLKQSFEQADAVVSANLTRLPASESILEQVYTFHVLHVIKASSDRDKVLLTREALLNRSVSVRLLNVMTGCAKTWHARQLYKELLCEYVLFLRHSNYSRDPIVSPRDESGVLRSSAGHFSPEWDACRYSELVDQAWGRCDDCVDEQGVLVEVGNPLVTDDGCRVCSCHARQIRCEPRFCDFHRAFIVVGAVLVVVAVVLLVACLYRRYRFRRQVHSRAARVTVSLHSETDAPVALDEDDDDDGGVATADDVPLKRMAHLRGK
jgi:hypothetical protein